MGAALYPLQHVHGLMTAVAILAGAVVYVLALLLVGAADAEEKRLLRRALRL
jgi:hypothetical protein